MLAVFLSDVAQVSVSPRSAAGFTALLESKQRQRMRAVSLFVNGSVFVGQRLGSAIRFRVDGVSCHAAIMACRVPASSLYGFGLGYCSNRLSLAASSAPPETGGALENTV
jgi:hypothetical protein